MRGDLGGFPKTRPAQTLHLADAVAAQGEKTPECLRVYGGNIGNLTPALREELLEAAEQYGDAQVAFPSRRGAECLPCSGGMPHAWRKPAGAMPE